MKSRKTQSSRNSRIGKLYKNRKRNIAIVVLLVFCLFIIYKINFLTKSEETIKLTSVKFTEYATGNILNEDLQIQEDEKGSYIILPETVQGLYAQKYYILNSNKVDNGEINNENSNEVNVQDNLNVTSNEIVENVVEEIENKIENTSVQSTNANEIEDDSLFDKAVQATQKEFLTPNEVSEDTEEKTTEAVNPEENDSKNEETNNTTVENSKTENNEETQNIVSQNTVTDTLPNETTNTVTNTELSDNKEQTANNNEETKEDSTKEENNQTDTESNLVQKQEKTEVQIDGISYNPGEKIYFDKETLDKDLAQITVEYQTVEINNLKLYKQDLKAEDDAVNVKVTGYIPLGNYLEIIKEDTNIYEELKADVEEIADSKVLFAYDIKITDGTGYYQPKEYFQTVNVSITSKTELEKNFSESLIQVLHIVESENESEKNIEFQKIAVTNKTDDSLEITTDEFSTYIVTALASTVTEDQVFIYDYESDKNYYTGKNYTDDMSGTNKKTYTDDTLAQVTVNYYSYDKDFEVGKTINLNKANWTTSKTTRVNNSLYTHTVTLTVTSNNNEFIDTNSPWEMTFNVPTGFLVNDTLARNSGKISNVSISGTNVTISNDSFANWTENSAKSYTLIFTLAFNRNTTVTNPTTFSLKAVNKQLVGYVSSTERQNLFTYVKCVPIVNGNISLELIDNPYMDRPKGAGFDGWITKESHTITTNANTKVQTLVTPTNGNKEITINLYANWKEANVVFVSSSGSTNNTGLSVNSPKSTFAQAATVLNTNKKNATNASDRELNIVVLTNGTFTGFSNLDSARIGYTITSLYDGVDYRNRSRIDFSESYSISYDLQLDFLNIYGYRSYGWSNTTNTYDYDDGTDNSDYYLCGNSKNLRIGRGMLPYNANNNVATFVQVQGGPDTSTSRAYRLVIESGKYANVQLGRADYSNSYSSNATLVMGCDFDRINKNNNDLQVYNRTASRTADCSVSPADSTKPMYLMVLKSGSFGMTNFLNTGTDYAYSGIYVGGHGSSNTDNGDRCLIVEGGNVANIIGGLMLQSSTTTVKTYIYIKGGTVQNIVGGAGVTVTYGDRIIQVTDGEIAYNVFGGSNGYLASTNSATGNNGRMAGNSLIYIGGNAKIGTKANTDTLYEANAGNVFGAGNGSGDYLNYSGRVNNSHVIVDGNAKISNSVYAGGNYGTVGNEENADLVTYTNSSSNFTTNTNYIISTETRNGNSLMDNNGNVGNSTITTQALPQASQEWILEQSGTGYYIKNASTGRYLVATRTSNNNATISLTNNRNSATIFSISSDYNNGVYIIAYLNYNSYYLRYNNGGWSGRKNSYTSLYFLTYKENEIKETEDLSTVTKIDILGGEITYNVYGGANQNGIQGSVEINMSGGIIDRTLYGGPNISGTIAGASKISITGGTIKAQEDDTSATSDAVFGGGKGSDTTISQRTVVNVIDKDNNINLSGSIYGGSALGAVKGSAYVNIGDNQSENISIVINGNIYGGGKGSATTAAKNSSNATVIVDGGTYPNAKAFGGCNVNGSIGGNVLVKIGENYKTEIDEVYGGGNQASITNITKSDYVYLYKNAIVNNAFNGGNSAGIDGDNNTTPRAIYSIRSNCNRRTIWWF